MCEGIGREQEAEVVWNKGMGDVAERKELRAEKRADRPTTGLRTRPLRANRSRARSTDEKKDDPRRGQPLEPTAMVKRTSVNSTANGETLKPGGAVIAWMNSLVMRLLG